jgi:malate synthase
MPKYNEVSGLSVAQELHEFIESEALVGLSVSAGQFWDGLSELAHELGPKNRALLSQRADIQKKIDDWHIARRGQAHDAEAYQEFLKEIRLLGAGTSGFFCDNSKCRSGNCVNARSAARGADYERTLCSERGQRPLGQPL